jgi:predicted kinase
MAKLAIICGLPRSGKTTWAKSLEDTGWIRICPDDIRLALHGQQYIKEAESSVWAIARARACTLLKGDSMVLIDATNLTRKSRSLWRKLANDFGLVLIIYLVETPYEVCLERNTGTGAVPQEVLHRMSRVYQRPTENEGQIVRQ